MHRQIGRWEHPNTIAQICVNNMAHIDHIGPAGNQSLAVEIVQAIHRMVTTPI